jgi:endonuclease/exonuclease/phosphatase (EEP) superfamily protein YafD
LEAALTIVGWLMVGATVLPLFRSEYWIVRIFDFPRLQITAVFCVVFAVYLFLREDPGVADNVFLGILAACLAYQLWRMWPYTPLHPRQVMPADEHDAARSVSLLISNILEPNRDSHQLLALIRELDPDIVMVVETDAWWEEQLREVERTRPHVVKHPRSNTYGMLFYSRHPLVDPAVRFLVEDDVPSLHTGVRLPSGEEVTLRGLHPRPPAPGESTRSTERDAELMIVAKDLQDRREPVIVFGDLNDVAWSRTNDLFQKISGLLDPRVGRGFYSTFNANWPVIRFPLDHAFVSRHFRVAAFRVLPHVGSDHFPVYVKLTLSPSTDEPNRDPPDPTPAEEREAQEKASKGSGAGQASRRQ